MALKHRRHLLHHIEVEPEQPIQPRALHFEHHLSPAAQAGAMDLRQRSRSQRFRIQIHHLGATLAELLLQNGLDLLEAEGGDAVLERRQFGDPTSRKDVRSGREQLSQLDEGRTQLQEFGCEPLRSPLLALCPTLGCDAAAIAPGLAIPPEEQQQREDRSPDAQCAQQPCHQKPASIERLISATEARNRSTSS